MYELVSLVNRGWESERNGGVATGRKKDRSGAKPIRSQDPEGTRKNIIEIASEEFARNGLSGARIDEIAARTRSSKRMIYYYFGDKEGLYLSALENAYRLVRDGESKLDVEGLGPLEALRTPGGVHLRSSPPA